MLSWLSKLWVMLSSVQMKDWERQGLHQNLGLHRPLESWGPFCCWQDSPRHYHYIQMDSGQCGGVVSFSLAQNLQRIKEKTFPDILGALPTTCSYVSGRYRVGHVLVHWKPPSTHVTVFPEEGSWSGLDCSPLAWRARGNSAVLVGPHRLPSLSPFWPCMGDIPAAYLGNYFLEERSSYFWKIMVAADPKSWPWTPANVFLTPKCPAKTK